MVKPVATPYRLKVYKSDCVIQRAYLVTPEPPVGFTREDIKEFSYKSRRRLAFVASNTDVAFKVMLTLTYPASFPGDGKEVKRHLQAMIRWLRHHKETLDYLWFLEFQKRGAPHIHMLINCDLSALPGKKDISAHWYKIVDSGDEKHLKAGTRTETLRSEEGGKRYTVKYAMKMEQKDVPEQFQNVGRFWGHSLRVKPKQIREVDYFTFEQLEMDLKSWRYKWHLRNYKVATLYNAAKELGNEG